jgi:hypothetical protein
MGDLDRVLSDEPESGERHDSGDRLHVRDARGHKNAAGPGAPFDSDMFVAVLLEV